MIKNKDIICITQSDWDEPKRCRHHLMSVLAKDNRVLFVERPIHISLLMKSIAEWKRMFKVLRGIRKEEKGLFLYAPPLIFPGGDWIPWINKINQYIIYLSIKYAVARLKIKNPILWIFSFTAGRLVGRFNENLSLYFCNDPFYIFAPPGRKREGIKKVERELVERVDYIFAVHHSLVEEKSKINKHTYLIPHGVRVDLFCKIDPTVPAEIKEIPSPRIGFVGVLGGKLDYKLIEHVADNKKEWSIVLIGPIAEVDAVHRQAIERLRKRSNVYLLGNKKQEELPNYIHSLNVCLLPYKESEFSRMFWLPLKFYEYLASGKPIVSNIILRGAMEYDESVIRTAEDRELFIEMVEKSLDNDSDELIGKRKLIAMDNSWQKRIQKIYELVSPNEKYDQ